MGKHIFCEQNNFQVTKRGRYLAKYRPNFLGTQFVCLRPGRSETVSSPSDTGDWIIQSSAAVHEKIACVEQIAERKSTVKITLILSTVGKSHLRNVFHTCNHMLNHYPSFLP